MDATLAKIEIRENNILHFSYVKKGRYLISIFVSINYVTENVAA